MGCLRRLQHWNLSSIIVEYRAYAGNKARYVNEQFIELFDIDWITLPANLPTWWIEQEAMWVGSGGRGGCYSWTLHNGFGLSPMHR
jgi:hypothetical protein